MKTTSNHHLISSLLSGILLLLITSCQGGQQDIYPKKEIVRFTPVDGDFAIVSEQGQASLLLDSMEFPGVIRAAEDFLKDIERVTGRTSSIHIDEVPEGDRLILAGTLGQNKWLDEWVTSGKLNVDAIRDKWEAYMIVTVDGIPGGSGKTLVVAGSDKRGTIYGLYELSEQMGVSPWYWWADVPAEKHAEIYVAPGKFIDFPAVKYRGIFINDEAPALSGWAGEKFGGFNHRFYENVFELILRLKGNFLWPAMWGSAFYDDDTLNPVLADRYGVVIGTSHHEPLMRAHDEWRRYGKGPWNYEENAENLQEFWRESIRERKDFEALITVGMRGDGDMAMTEGTAIALLEKIIEDQRKIIAEETGKDPAQVPQVWALYKEVQDYYNKGMRVPQDITLLLCDDNWGNVRVLPKPGTPEREGGYGMYYHFDFVGGPVSYRWLNVSPISRTWEQMNLSWEHGVKKLWIVNVGDIKPMEFPISFFLDQAWDPESMTAEAMGKYSEYWATQQFGEEYAPEIADLLRSYTRYNYRRTPEMLKPDTYSLYHYREAETVVKDYNELLKKAGEIAQKLPEESQDAFYELVTHPIEACANLNEMYLATAKNHLYARQGRVATNAMADRVKELFDKDAEITRYYHEDLAGGKWNLMMSQTHIGYTSWNNPPQNYMPEVKRIKVPKKASLGLMVEGDSAWWPQSESKAVLPVFDNLNQQEYYIELFNRGREALDYTASTKDEWIKLSDSEGKLTSQERIMVSIDWDAIPAGENISELIVTADTGEDIPVEVRTIKYANSDFRGFSGFVEANNYISMEAEHFTGKSETSDMHWQVIPEFGRTLSGVTVLPTTHPAVEPGGKNPNLEYDVYVTNPGDLKVNVYVAPSLNIYNDEGMRFATSFDEQDPVIYRIHEFDTIPDWFYPDYWNKSVTDNIRILSTVHKVENTGPHRLKLWMVTPGVVFEKIVIETGKTGDSYLGPPESFKMK